MRSLIHATRRGALVAVILSLFAVSGAALPELVRADAPDATCPAQTGWLPYFNSFRTMANIAGVTEDTTLTQGDCNHSRYMVKNTITHTEDPANQWYTASGAYAGTHSNVAISFGGTYTFQDAINGWMTGPFHEIGILDPRLTQSAFALYNEGTSYGGTLDVLSRLNGAAPVAPVYFPANGKTMTLDRYDGNESPDPLTSCPGYTAPTGPPLALQLLVTPAVTAFSFSKVGVGTLPACEFDQNNYANAGLPAPGQPGSPQDLGRAVLGGRNAIIIMPQAPLTNGTYQVSVTSNGNTYAWSFNFGVVAPTLQSITVTPANPTLKAGNPLQFTATGNYSDASTQNLTNQVTWGSSVPGFATINAAGLATGVAAGATTISATSGAIVGQTTLNVFVPTLQSIIVTPANASLMIGNTLQFSATGVYSDNSTQNLTNQVTWASSATGIATITGGGLVTAVAPGPTTISATSGAIVGQTTLNVTVAPMPPGTRYIPASGPPPLPTEGQNRGGGGGLGPVDVKPGSRP